MASSIFFSIIMGIKKYFFYTIISLFGILFISCGTSKDFTNFSKRKYYDFPRRSQNIVLNDKKELVALHEEANNETSGRISCEHQATLKVPVFYTSAIARVAQSEGSRIITEKPTASGNKVIENTQINKRCANISPLINYLPENTTENKPSKNKRTPIRYIALIVVAILLPPFAILIYDKNISIRFFIDLAIDLYDIVVFFALTGLSLAFYLIFGGIAAIFALLIITGVFKVWGPKQGNSTDN